MLGKIKCIWGKLKHKGKVLTEWDNYQTTIYKFLMK
jgi:hypothetical protein